MDTPQDQISSGLAFRLCECLTGEIIENSTFSSVTVPSSTAAVLLGTVVQSRWHPTLPSLLTVLYSSGILRIHDVVTQSYRDFSLYIPTSGIPDDDSTYDSKDTDSSFVNIRRTAVNHRRAVTPIHYFDFLPYTENAIDNQGTKVELPKIVFSIKTSVSSIAKLYVTDIPLHQTIATVILGGGGGNSTVKPERYLLGSRVYECYPHLPSEITYIRTWMVSYGTTASIDSSKDSSSSSSSSVPPTNDFLACVAIGCLNGSLHVYGVSKLLNPLSLTALQRHSSNDTMPRLVKLNSFPSSTASTAPSSSSSSSTSTTVTAHTKRVRYIAPLMMTQPGIALPVPSVSNGLASYASSNNIFITSSDDGMVKLWILSTVENRDTNDQTQNNYRSGSRTNTNKINLTVHPYVDVPVDGVPVTAISSSAWPWDFTGTPSEPLLSSVPWLMSSPLFTYGYASSSIIQAGSRTLLSLGNQEGVISLFEIIVPAHIRSVLEPFSKDRIGQGTLVSGLSVPGLSSLPSIRLTGMITTRSFDPIMDIALSPSFTSPAEPYKLAVASADGKLKIYKIDGTTAYTMETDGQIHRPTDPLAPGGTKPLSIIPQGESSSSNSTIDNPVSSSTSYDIIRNLGPEAVVLQHFAATVESNDDSTNNKDKNHSGHPSCTLSVDAAVQSGNIAARRITTALSSAAITLFEQAILSCSFNDEARKSLSLYPDDHPLYASIGALVGCKGNGELLLWSRDSLPGEITEEDKDNDENVTQVPQTPPLQQSTLSRLHHHHPSSSTVPKDTNDSLPDDSDNEEPLPQPPPTIQIPVIVSTTVPSTTPTDNDDSHNENENQAPTLPRVLNLTTTSKARLDAVAQTLKSLRHREHIRHRTKSPARSILRTAAKDAVRSVYNTTSTNSRNKSHVRTGQTAVERAHHRLGISTTTTTTTNGTVRNRSRSLSRGSSIPNLAQRKEGTVIQNTNNSSSSSNESGYNSEDGILKGTNADASLHTSYSNSTTATPHRGRYPSRSSRTGSVSYRTGKGETKNTKTGNNFRQDETNDSGSDNETNNWARMKGMGLDRTGTIATSVSMSMGDMTTMDDDDDNDVDDPISQSIHTRDHTLNMTMQTQDHQQPPVRSTSTSSISASKTNQLRRRLSTKTSGPYLDPAFRSPARIAATLVKDASLNMRSAALLAKDNLGTADAAVDEHPDAVAAFIRSINGNDPHAHLVAPTLGSSAALALEIRRLEEAQFNEEFEIRDILSARRITDPVILQTLLQRSRERTSAGNQAPAYNEPLPYEEGIIHPQDVFDVQPDANIYSETLPPVSKDYQAERQRSRSRSKSVKHRSSSSSTAIEPGYGRPIGDSPDRNTEDKDKNTPTENDGIPTNNTDNGPLVSAADVFSWQKGLRGRSTTAPTVTFATVQGGSRTAPSTNVRTAIPPPPIMASNPVIHKKPLNAQQRLEQRIQQIPRNYVPVPNPGFSPTHHQPSPSYGTTNTMTTSTNIPHRSLITLTHPAPTIPGRLGPVPTINYNPVVRSSGPLRM